MYRYTRCSLEYIEGVVRLSGSSAGVERMCLRTRRVRELRGRIETHHRGASVPTALLVWRIMVREQPEATTRRRPRPRPRTSTKLSVDDLHTRNARAGRDAGLLGIPLPWRASSACSCSQRLPPAPPWRVSATIPAARRPRTALSPRARPAADRPSARASACSWPSSAIDLR